MESPSDTLFNELWDSIGNPSDRLTKIAKQLRQIAVDLEAGKEVTPKKIRKMAGSLAYWTNEFDKAAFNLLSKPNRTMQAIYEAREAHKKERQQGADIL